MPTIYLSDEQLVQVRSACLDYTFLGYKFGKDWTDDNEVKLRNSILSKLGVCGDDSDTIHWHSEGCMCRGCSKVRKERKQIEKFRSKKINESESRKGNKNAVSQ